MRYQKIESKIWNDEKFTRLTPMQQRLFFYILTCPHGNLIGLFVLKKGYICEDLKCLPKDLDKDLTSLCESKLIYFDNTTQVVWIKNFLKHNPITNPNQRKAAVKMIMDLPNTFLLQQFLVLNKELAEVLPEVLLKPDSESDTDSDSETDTDTEEEVLAKVCVSKNGKLSMNDLAELWNQTAPDILSRVNIPFKRKDAELKKLKASISINPDKSFWEDIFTGIGSKPFLLGGGANGWKASFDFCVLNANKIADGKYDQNKLGQRAINNMVNAWEFANE